MPLSPEDVRNKVFTTVRLREGYDADEVDAFLDEAEAELARLIKDNDTLRRRLAAVGRAAAQNGQPPAAVHQRNSTVPGMTSGPPGPARQPMPMGRPMFPQRAPAGGVPPLLPQPLGTDDATFVVEMAGRAADQIMREARAESERIISEARRLADGLQYAAHCKGEALEREAEARCRIAMAPYDSVRDVLEVQVGRLRDFEREYRTRLAASVDSHIRRLDTTVFAPALPAPPSEVRTRVAVPAL